MIFFGKIFLFYSICLLTLIPDLSFAQEKEKKEDKVYIAAIGFRGGYYPGITAKYFPTYKSGIEGILSTHSRGIIITGLYELYSPAFKTNNLDFFYGLGAHAGRFKGENYRNQNGDFYQEGTYIITVGVDGILGLEYLFTQIPFTVGAEIKPFLDLINPGRGNWDGALCLRYLF